MTAVAGLAVVGIGTMLAQIVFIKQIIWNWRVIRRKHHCKKRHARYFLQNNSIVDGFVG